MSETENRRVRLCESCLQVDDHPRHVLATNPGDGATDPDTATRALTEAAAAGHDLSLLIEQIRDDSQLDKHIDCCAADGCETCQAILDQVGDKRGLDLAKALAPKDN